VIFVALNAGEGARLHDNPRRVVCRHLRNWVWSSGWGGLPMSSSRRSSSNGLCPTACNRVR
jgi:hypothetical protein